MPKTFREVEGVRASRRMRTATAWPSCFETHRSTRPPWKHLSSRRAAMLLSMRARTAGRYGSRLSLRSAGTTMAWAERRTNLRLYEIAAGAIPLFPGCYLQ